jgi:hypothetical protein
MNNSKGQRVRDLFNAEAKQLLSVFENIERLIPHSTNSGSAHSGEEGRFIEYLIRDFLNKHLPNQLEAFTGFIHRPATKTGNNNRTRRRKEIDKHSAQIDIIVYDKANYPFFEKFQEFVIVPPEGVIGLVSVKKALRTSEIDNELESLYKAVGLCYHTNQNGEVVRGPSTSIISFKNKLSPKSTFEKRLDSIYKKIQKKQVNLTFDQCIGQILTLDNFCIFKKRPNNEENFDKKANYVGFQIEDENDLHFSLQFLLTSILSAYYHKSRSIINRPGFTSFPTNKKHKITLGEIDVRKLR